MNPDFSTQEADRNKRLLFAAQAVIADASPDDASPHVVTVDRSVMDDLHAIVREFHDAALAEINAALDAARAKAQAPKDDDHVCDESRSTGRCRCAREEN